VTTSRTPGACPCGGVPHKSPPRQPPRSYAQCCGRYIDGGALGVAPDAESLMRSRYTAFALGRGDYLRASWHPTRRPAELVLDADTQWLGLEVRAHQIMDDCHAEVEFVARMRHPGGRASRLHERSRFVREDGRWYYLDGQIV
jgi:SEC-C motif domain protein